MRIKRILVPVDFSPGSSEALEVAADFAKAFDADLIVLSVIEPVVYVVPDYGGAQSSAVAELMNEQRRNARTELTRLERRYAKRGLKLRSLLLIGRPSQVIGDAAEQSKADLIVMTTHGRTGVSRLLMGSVTERVVRTARCPVMTLHGRARPGRAPRRRSKPSKRT